MTEKWHEVEYLPGYQISDLGRLRSPHRGILKGHVIIRNGKPSSVRYSIGRKAYAAHRLVLDAFIGPCPDGMEGCHNDGDGTNNAKTNLRWDTHQSNMQDAISVGTFVTPAGFKAKPFIKRGSDNPRAQLTADQVQDIRTRLASGERPADIARTYGVTKHLIAHISLGRSWRWLPPPPSIRLEIAKSLDKVMDVI